MSTVLVTGGTGFIASWTVLKLLNQGYEVRASVRSAERGEHLHSVMAHQGTDSSKLTAVVADLNSAEGWAQAVEGVDAVIHMASPLGGDNQNDTALIDTAKNGVRHVLQAALDARVPRVVLTSSLAAATPPNKFPSHYVDEKYWTDPHNKEINAYRLSKLFAEELAWEMVAGQTHTQLSTVLPGAVFGPVLDGSSVSSVEIIQRTLRGQVPIMNITYQVVDVRDVADLHILAMQSDAAAGERFLAVSGPLTAKSLAETLRSELGNAGQKVSTRQVPNFIPRVAALFIPQVRSVVPMLSRKFLHTNKKARAVLGWQPFDPRTTVADTGKSLVEKNLV